MARREEDREDLLAEAKALVERVELSAAGFEDSIVAGFRSKGALSIYFGADPAVHFTSAGELRRAYIDGKLIKAEHRRLVSLTRRREPGETQLVRHELTGAESDALVSRMRQRLMTLRASLHSGEFQVIGQQ